MHKGLGELQLLGLAETEATQIHIAQPSGCNPIASAILAEEAEVHPVMPETAAHSLAIGAPGDGYLVIDAVHKRGGTAAFASDPEIFAGIDLLAATEGLLTEPAGGTTIAVLEKLAAAGRFAPDDTVVALITGNGLKTLDEHPPKEWPAKIECELEPMLGALSRAQAHADADADGARAVARLSASDHRKTPPLAGLSLSKSISRILSLSSHPSVRPTWTSAGYLQTVLSGLASSGVCPAAASPRRWCALTAPFHPCRPAAHVGRRRRRFVSVALSRGFPRVDSSTTLPCDVRTFLEGFSASAAA